MICTLPVSVPSVSSRSVTRSSCCLSAISSAGTSTSGGQGLLRKRKTAPRLTASAADFWSALPVSMSRTVSGEHSRTASSSSTPLMPGMVWSATITA